MTKMKADKIAEDKNFYRKDLVIDDVQIYIYNYFFNDYEAFKNKEARELRGLTITHAGSEQIHWSIPKFFNINETEETQYAKLKYKKIKRIREKLDGSMIQFIPIAGNFYAKTKQSFTNPQAKAAQAIFDQDEELEFFILDCYANYFHPVFELIGPDNRHVVDYPEDKLVLTVVRNNDGEMMNIDNFTYSHKAKKIDISLDELVEDAKTSNENKEGYIIQFEDGVLAKVKTLSYLEKHRLADITTSYKDILGVIIDDTLDDVLSVVTEDRKDMLIKYQKLVNDYILNWAIFVQKAANEKLQRKDLAAKYKDHRFFGVIMGSQGKELKKIQEMIGSYVKRKYNREEKAKKFLRFLETGQPK